MGLDRTGWDELGWPDVDWNGRNGLECSGMDCGGLERSEVNLSWPGWLERTRVDKDSLKYTWANLSGLWFVRAEWGGGVIWVLR